MKANEAPERIYFDGESRACKLPIFSSCNIEYTRTDAFIETLEVKEVNIEKELIDYHNKNFSPCNDGTLLSCETGAELTWNDYESIAKHFFELGLNANQENNVIGTFEREVKIDAGGYPYIDCDIEFYDYDKDIPLAKKGDKVKVIVIKED